MARAFNETKSGQYVPPILIGLMGGPGAGKTYSALRIAKGMSAARGGPVVLIDTEAGRALKYKVGAHNPNGFGFIHVDFSPPFVPVDFLEAIRQQLPLNPSAIIVDSMSDEHVGEGGYLDWHDREVPNSGGNEWAAWKKPSASRQKLVSGIQHISTPLIFTFRAREKTKQVGKKVEKIGLQPLAPLEIIHTLDLTCLLPTRSNGVAIWQSPKEAEDFIVKYPSFLAQFIRQGSALDEDFGEALARWQSGDTSPPADAAKRTRTPEEMVDAYVAGVNACATLDDLREYQTDERRKKWSDRIRDTRPDLHDRIVTASSRRANELSPAIDDGDGDDFSFDDDQAVDGPGEGE